MSAASLSSGLAALSISGAPAQAGGARAPPSSAGAGAASPLPSTPASPSSTQSVLIVGTLNLSLRVRYGMTSRHVPLYLFTPYDPAYPSYRVACSTPEKENHVALIEPYVDAAAGGGGGGGGEEDAPAPAAGAPAAAGGAVGASVALPRGTLVRLLGRSGDSEAEAEALKWQAVPFPPYPDPAKEQGAWLAAELAAASARLAAALAPDAPAPRPLLDWPATFNIDNATTRDIDDVVSVRRSAQGGWDFAVTIADVAACVPQGSLLDVRARELGQTLYSLAGEALRPMLPHALSERECSLVAGTLRAGVALYFHWDGTTTPAGTSITCSGAFAPVRLLNRHSFAYESVGQAGEAAGLGAELRALAAAAGELGRRLGVAGRDLAGDPHTWVEALMLFYNVAAGVRVQGARAGLLRKHGAATRARLDEYEAVNPALAHLAYSAAVYTPADDAAPRHWGLSADVYAHASSPIRRYSDLFNQRVLVGSAGGGGGEAGSEDGALCAWLNARAQKLKRYQYDAFFLSAIVASSLMTVSAVFLRLCAEVEEGGGGGGGGGAGGGGAGAEDNGESPDEDADAAPAGGAAPAPAPAPAPAGRASKGRVQRRAEFWVEHWKRIVRLRLTIVAEEPAPAKAFTVLTKDESQTYVLRPGAPVTLKAFANLRGKNWKKSMVFSCLPASG